MQPDDGLARPRRAADPARAVEAAADELGLVGVEEGRPLLDGAGEDALHEGGLDLVLGEQRVLHGLGRRGQHRLGHGDAHRRGRPDLREQRERAGQDGVDLRRREAGAMGGDVPQHVLLPHDPHRVHGLVDPLPTGQDDDGPHLPRREAHLGEVRLDEVAEVRERQDVVGDVLLAAVDAAGVDDDVLPRLGVDDEHPARADDDQVHLGASAAGPAPVGEEVVSDGAQRGEGLRRAALGDLRDGIPARCGTGHGGCLRVGVSECELPARLSAGGVACGHVGPLPFGKDRRRTLPC